ncbi:hypothetical protein LMJ53_16650 [Rheinheimera sp. UJ51]|uniref:hypothetical protein n=1 Tax=Rheinheimera sp. UJ51 TaxID=2892446 RepID=UPI001E6392C8|nr:hypothetical protein [Rheinheimera sp. UJ51]MCC5453347.1 hypothetical protein [Rheinheimera sp. UJ51]
MAENVEVIDVETGDVSTVSSDQIGPGMVRVSYEGKEYWADSAQLQQNEYQHEPFQGEMKTRIESIMNNLSEVYSLSYEEWEDGFRRDQHPINEIVIWERIVSVYKHFSNRASSLASRKEIYSVIVTCSYSEPNQVLNQVSLNELTEEEAREIIRAYYQKT